jgi:hypothetical protein
MLWQLRPAFWDENQVESRGIIVEDFGEMAAQSSCRDSRLDLISRSATSVAAPH